jgi:pre-mRNA-splicing factor ISY1
MLDLPDDTPVPPLPEAQYVTLDLANAGADDEDEGATTGEKRKALGGADDEAAAKKAKSDAGRGHRFLTVLRAEDLRPPKLPTEKEIADLIVEQQRQELLKEYLG